MQPHVRELGKTGTKSFASGTGRNGLRAWKSIRVIPRRNFSLLAYPLNGFEQTTTKSLTQLLQRGDIVLQPRAYFPSRQRREPLEVYADYKFST